MYAALICHDDGVEISGEFPLLEIVASSSASHKTMFPATHSPRCKRAAVPLAAWAMLFFLSPAADNISAILKAASITIDPYWPSLFAKLCQGKDIGAMLSAVGSAGKLNVNCCAYLSCVPVVSL